MKYTILHESRGRVRLRAGMPRMTLAQADIWEAWLSGLPMVEKATVHDRTCTAIILYRGERPALLRTVAGFDFSDAQPAPENVRYGRELNRAYEEKLVGKIASRVFRRLFFPAPLRIAWTVCRSAPYLWKGLRKLLRGWLHVEVLDAASIGVSMLRGDFLTAGSVMFLLSLGELLEEWTHKKSVDDLARSMSLNIDRAWLVTDGAEVQVPLTRLRTGDRIRVRTGGMIPIDGILDEGEAMVNQASLTGESLPVVKRPGTAVYAGTVVEEGEGVIRVTEAAGASRYDRIVEMIEQSERLKSAAESKASNLADHLVPYTLAGSALLYLLTRNVTRALSVLMVDFSCALKLSMPLAVLSAMREAGNRHITVKGGRYMEAAARADTVIFDKTGTLTHACPQVAQVVPFGGRDADEMLRVAACLEEHFPHSLANAVVRAAAEKGLAHEEMHSTVEYIVAHGIASTIDGQRVVIGSYHFVFEDEGCRVPEGEQAAFDALPPEYSQLYLAIDGVLAAVICIADPLRREAREVMTALRAMGVTRTVMLTGDSERTAAAIAAQVGVDEYHAEVLPEDKAGFIAAEQARGRTVIMIGDGINDSPALSAADAGIAIRSGAAIARQIADITIAADDLRALLDLRLLSQGLMGRIRHNYRTVMGFNGSLIALGALGVLPPATSALLHNTSTLLISLRSMTSLLDENGRLKPHR